MKILTPCWLILLLLGSGPVLSQSKIGYVDLNAVLEQAPQIALGRRKLDEEFRPRNQALRAQQAQLEAAEQRLVQEGPLMSAEQIASLERDVRALRRTVTRDEKELFEEFDYRLKQERQQVEKQIYDVVSQYATENRFDLVTPGPVLFASESIDFTQQIIERLRVEYARSESNR